MSEMSSLFRVTKAFSFYRHVAKDKRWFCVVLLGRSFQSPGIDNVTDIA